MRRNRIKAALSEGRAAIGTMLMELGTRGVAKMIEYAGLDWTLVDMEHNGYSMDHIADLMAWFKATDVTPLVRVPADNLPHFLSGAMDAGAMGVVAAHVDGAADAKRIVDAVMYPPLGTRGVGLNAAHTDFRRPRASEYMPARNGETTIFALIESRDGLENIEEIAAFPGIFGLQPSRNDLSVELGVPGDYEHPVFKAAVGKISEAARRHGKALAINPNNDGELPELYRLGYRVIGIRNAIVAFQDTLKGDVDRLRRQVATMQNGERSAGASG